MSSSIITFRRGPFQGWGVEVDSGRWVDGAPVHVIVRITLPAVGLYKPGGTLGFRHGIDGWDVARDAAIHGGSDRVADLLGWIIEGTREALDHRTDVPADRREHWTRIVELADETRADFFARYPDGTVPAFEIVGGNTAGHAMAAA